MSHDDRVFDCFNLPRELRDEVYSYLTKDLSVESGSSSMGSGKTRMRVILKHVQINKVRLLNHQFKTEYDERTKYIYINTLEDTGGTPDDQIPPSRLLRRPPIVRLEIHVLGAVPSSGSCEENWEEAIEDIVSHTQWISCLPKVLSELKRLKIHVYFSSTCEDRQQWMQHRHAEDIGLELEHMTNIPKIDALEVYTFEWPEGMQKPDRKGESVYKCLRGPVAEWKVDGGWKE